MEKFDPNALSFDEGLDRIKRIAEGSGFSPDQGILTSRDESVAPVIEKLRVQNVPEGFTKWQLPVYLPSASQLYISVAEPGAEVPTHSHREGDGIRFIAGGSITYEGKELTQGDWMYIPAGREYTFEVGRFGAIMCYCYCCSCAGAMDFLDDPGGPIERTF